jgi:flagellar motor switch protein FliG
MGTANPQKRESPRIYGHAGSRDEAVQVARWKPLTEAEVDALPLPKVPPTRGWELARPVPAEVASEAIAARSSQRPPPVSEAPQEPAARPAWIVEGSVQEMAWERPAEVAAIVRSLLRDGQRVHEADILCAGLGLEVCAEVLRQLSEAEAVEVAEAIAAMAPAPEEAARQVLEELRQRLQSGQPAAGGGIGYARAAIERALGPRKALEVVGQMSARVAWELLAKAQPDQVAPFLSHEHPQTIALILSQLEPSLAAAILCLLPEALQAEVSWRMATLEAVPSAVLRHIGESLEYSFRETLARTLGVGGPKVVADVLNLTGPGVEKRVLEQMDAQDAKVAEAVRNLMFVFDDLGKLSDQDIQVLLREVDQRDLAISLKAATDELRNRLLSNVPEQAREAITQEVEYLGPMRLREVEQVQLRIVQLVRRLEEEGRITIVRGRMELYV